MTELSSRCCAPSEAARQRPFEKDAWQVRARARRPMVFDRRTGVRACTFHQVPRNTHETTRGEEGKKENRDAPCTGFDPIDRIPSLRTPSYVIEKKFFSLSEKKPSQINYTLD